MAASEALLNILRQDYQRFPHQQTFEIYAEDVYFKDPLNKFRGRDRYQKTIQFIETWFKNPHLNLHDIRYLDDREQSTIRTDWTLHWTTPLPWQPRIAIPGWSELIVNDDNKITSHIDFWHCSAWDVIKQHFSAGLGQQTRS